MNKQSGETEEEEEEVIGEGIGESKMEELDDDEIKGVDSRDKVKHNERSDQLF